MRHPEWIVLDVETAPDTAAADFLEEPTAAANLRDPEKIAADIQRKRDEQQARMSLDPYAGRIVCIGFQTDDMPKPATEVLNPADNVERYALEMIVDLLHIPKSTRFRQVIGFRVQAFDLPFLMTRARLLGVAFPPLDLRKYGNRDVTDLWSVLTFDGALEQGCFRRSLKNLARRFGIPVNDETSGADVAALVEAQDWPAIAAHCASDVRLTVALAARLGIIALVEIEEPLIPF